ncbi:MAG: phosphate ABC transporter permease PstA, partial [Thermoguttaceae bacterium]
MLVVLANGLPVFWPHRVAEVQRLVGVVDREGALAAKVEQETARAEEALAERRGLVERAAARFEAVQREQAEQFDAAAKERGEQVEPSVRAAAVRRAAAAALYDDPQLAQMGAAIDGQGTITFEDGTQRDPDGTVQLPDGTRIEPDGTLLLPAGARVGPGGAVALAVEPGATIPLMAHRLDEASEPLPLEALNLTVPLLQAVDELGSVPPGEKVSEVTDDGRVFTTLLGQYVEQRVNRETGVSSWKYKTGNREYGPAFRWVEVNTIGATTYPPDAVVLERMENLNFYGYLDRIQTPGFELPDAGPAIEQLDAALAAAEQQFRRQVAPLKAEEDRVGEELRREVKYAMIRAEYRLSQLQQQGEGDSPAARAVAASLDELRSREQKLLAESDEITRRRVEQENSVRANLAVFTTSDGRETPIALVDIVRAYRPNRMGFGQQAWHYLAKVWELLSTDPREANQDGGLFPAIFGTVLLVFLMAVTCFPLGVLAGVYLGEYAKDGPLVRVVRIAVNNLAGIPSIVYGIFGLGFFIYICGGTLDAWLYPARVQAREPVFGQGCIFWASLTLGLLTIPVVIVATEESLRTIPRGVKEGSYALGATKFQTLWRVLIPMASPGMMTGFILAMARAAGEVAPLMLTGAVKLASVPVQGEFPFIRLNGQFMHLG